MPIGNHIFRANIIYPSSWPFPYDSLESYAVSTDLNGLNGGFKFNAAYVSRNNPFGIISYDDMESYVSGSDIVGQNGGDPAFGGYYVVASLLPPTINPFYQPTLPATFSISQSIGAPIYYTTDGSAPTISSTLYSGSFVLSNTASIKAISIQTGYSNSPTISVSYPSPVLQTETLDWYNRILSQSSTVNTTQLYAADSFIGELKTNNLYYQAYRVGAYLGDDLNALKAPLINVSGSVTESVVGFVAADYTSNGLIGGSGKSLKTGFVPTAITPSISSSFSMGVYTRTAGAPPAYYDMGCYNGTQYAYLLINVPSTYWSCWYNFAQINATTGYTGSFIGNRSGSALNLYRNGSSIASGTDTNTTMVQYDIWVHTLNANGSDPGNNSTKQICFYWIGKTLTSGEHATLHNAIQRLQTSCSRQV